MISRGLNHPARRGQRRVASASNSPEPQEQHQVDQRDQPDEVPGHQIELVASSRGPDDDPGGDLELAARPARTTPKGPARRAGPVGPRLQAIATSWAS